MTMHPPDNLPPPLRTDGSDPFAHRTMRDRHPDMLQSVLDANPNYPDFIREDLLYLQQALANNGPISMLNLFPSPPPDYVEWASAFIDRRSTPGQRTNPPKQLTWLDVDWFFAETYLFRLIVQAVRWWELERDPFAPMKQDELNSTALWRTLNTALSLDGGVIDRIPELVRLATFGNRIDQSYTASAEQGTAAADDDLVVDDSEAVKSHLLNAQLELFPGSEQGITHIIVDNAGTELAMDLALTDALLTGISDVVILHVKYHPTFVSDATAADVRGTIQQAVSGNHGGQTYPAIFSMGQRLQSALNNGRLRLAPNLFWNSAHFLWEMPRVLQRVFDESQLVILKGDANYRRAIGDAAWDPTTPFDQVMSYFPYPLLALRTLKSTPVVGLPPGLPAQLDQTDREWRTNAKRGVVQLNIR